MHKITRSLSIAALTLASSAVLADTKVEQMAIPVVKCQTSTGKTVAINTLECTAASCQAQGGPGGGMAALAGLIAGNGGVQGIGNGMRSMLTNAIRETGCFKLVDLDQFKKMREMLAATGQTVAPPKIDLMIAGQITALELSKEGGALGGGFIPLLGLISKNTEKASMQLDLTSMNPQTLEINEARSFSANSDKSSWGFAAVGGGVGGGWSISKSLALDMVARDIIVSSANYLAETYAAGNITSRPAPAPAN